MLRSKLLVLMVLIAVGLPSTAQLPKSSGKKTVDNAKDKNPITLHEELRRLWDISALPAYLPASVSGQASSYDTTGGNDDGFSGRFSFVRKKANGNLVLADITGPGVITRFSTPTPTGDTLDFYIDDTLRPALSIYYTDLFSGKVFPFIRPLCDSGAGGYYMYFPILFQQRCMIVSRGSKEQFHQIQYRTYPMGTRIQSFTNVLDAADKKELENIGTSWQDISGKIAKNTRTINKTIRLSPGDSGTCFSTDHGGRIAAIELASGEEGSGAFKNITLQVSWDDEAKPAIDCPLSDFFGYALDKPSMQGLLVGTKGGRNYCYFPMPFDNKAKVTLRYKNQPDSSLLKVEMVVTIRYTDQKRDPQKEGRLYVRRVHEQTTQGLPHVLAKINGRGHYVGTILLGQGLKTGLPFFWEGDDESIIDGKLHIHGTGTEDYFNGGWYDLKGRWDTARSFPLSGCLVYSAPKGVTGGYRLYLSDKLGFERSLLQDIEHGPVKNNIDAIYTSVAFYYCNSPQVN